MIIYIMSEWRLMNTRSESITLTNLCATNGFDRDPNELYIYRLNHSSEYSGNTISKENWVRIKVDDSATSIWNVTAWELSTTTTENLNVLPSHTAYWIKVTTGGGDGTTPIEITSAMTSENITIVSNKTYVVNDTITYTGAITIKSGGTLRIDGGGILNITSADTINNEAGGTIENFGTINSVAGGIDGSGTIDGAPIIGTFNGTTFTPTPSGSTGASGGTPLTNSINQINDGETYIVNDHVTVTTLNISSGGTLTIVAGKKLKVNAVLSNSGDIINNGTIENNVINNINGTITNNGQINTSVDVNGTTSGDGTVIIGTFNSNDGSFIPPFVVTVNGSMKFEIDGAEQATITLTSGQTYNFDVSHSSNDGHIFRFSTTSNGTHGGGQSYTTDVNESYNITTLTVTTDTPSTLYYYCSEHSDMGGTITIQ